MENTSDSLWTFLEFVPGNRIPVSSIFVLLIVNSEETNTKKTNADLKKLFSSIWNSSKIIIRSYQVKRKPYVYTEQWLNEQTNKKMHKYGRQREKPNVANTSLPKLEPVNRVALMLSFCITTSLRRSMFFRRELASFSV